MDDSEFHTSLLAVREAARALEPKVRASLMQLITEHRPNLSIEALNSFTTRQLIKLAESCVPDDTATDPPANTAQPTKFFNLFDICDPTTRAGRQYAAREERRKRREARLASERETQERQERYLEQLRERSRKRGLLDPSPMFKPDVCWPNSASVITPQLKGDPDDAA